MWRCRPTRLDCPCLGGTFRAPAQVTGDAALAKLSPEPQRRCACLDGDAGAARSFARQDMGEGVRVRRHGRVEHPCAGIAQSTDMSPGERHIEAHEQARGMPDHLAPSLWCDRSMAATTGPERRTAAWQGAARPPASGAKARNARTRAEARVPCNSSCGKDQAATATGVPAAAFAWATMALNASGSCTARSARTLRSTSIPAFDSAAMKRE